MLRVYRLNNSSFSLFHLHQVGKVGNLSSESNIGLICSPKTILSQISLQTLISYFEGRAIIYKFSEFILYRSKDNLIFLLFQLDV